MTMTMTMKIVYFDTTRVIDQYINNKGIKRIFAKEIPFGAGVLLAIMFTCTSTYASRMSIDVTVKHTRLTN